MFGLSYGNSFEENPDILEIRPNVEESEKFWIAYQGDS
jgi:hypothetical protein